MGSRLQLGVDRRRSTLRIVGFSRRLRRQGRRLERARPWRRAYTYKEERIPSRARVIIPISSDAPYEERDARFWNWVLLLLILVGVVVAVALVVTR